MKIDIAAVRMDLVLNITTSSAFLYLTSSEMWGKLLVDYFGSTVVVGRKIEHIVCGVNSPLTLAQVAQQRMSLMLETVLLCVEVSHWCSSELVMIHLKVLKGSADPQDEVKSYSLGARFCFQMVWTCSKVPARDGSASFVALCGRFWPPRFWFWCVRSGIC